MPLKGWFALFCLAGTIFVAGCAAAPPPADPAPPLPTSAQAGGNTIVAVQPPAQPCCKQTLPEWLGLTKLGQGLGLLFNRIRARLGTAFPGLEAKPALTQIADPANLESDNPAIKAAAEVKADKDAAAQKAKALKYLGSIGCTSCYPDVEAALLAALDDCTEEVRFAAVLALRETTGNPCHTCKTSACCSPEVMQKLDKIANDVDDTGCFIEPSARVRRVARLAMRGCGGAVEIPATPEEGPSMAPEGPDEESATETAGIESPAPATKTVAVHAPNASIGHATPSSIQRTSFQPSVSIPPPAANSAANLHPVPQLPIEASDSVPETHGGQGRSASAPPRPFNPVDDRGTTPRPLSENELSSPNSSTTSIPSRRGAVLARVNGEPIYEYELIPQVDAHLASLGTEVPVLHKLELRRTLVERKLPALIDRKLLCQQARRAIEAARFESLSTEDSTNSPTSEIDRRVSELLQDEEALAADWLRRSVRVDEQVTDAEIAEHYRGHTAEFDRPEAVRWESVIIPVDATQPRTEAEAIAKFIASRARGIQVPPPPNSDLSRVAVTQYEWTELPKIGDAALQGMLSHLPIGAPSSVVDDGNSLQVVRVLARRPAGPAPLEAVLTDVRKRLLEQRRAEMEKLYVGRLRAAANIWTQFDDPRPKARVVAVKPR